MKKVQNNNMKETLRLAAANTLRRSGFEVYLLPVTSVEFVPQLVAYKHGRFYYVYLYGNREDLHAEFFGKTKERARKYARPLNAKVVAAVVRLRSYE